MPQEIKIERIKIENGVELCFCSDREHRDYSPSENFSKHPDSPHGFQYTCNPCRKKQINARRGIVSDLPDDVLAKQLLSNLGYDYDSYESIHQQFMKKYNLKWKK